MSDEDPFGLINDAARTRVRPVAPPRQTAPPAAQGAAPDTVTRHHPNGLIAAFAPLLSLAPELEGTAPPSEPDILHARLLEDLTRSRDMAIGAGTAGERADRAAWYVAATLDDVVLNTPWGGASRWPGRTLVSSLSGDIDTGTKFYDRLEELQRYPERDPDMLELIHACLTLGFRGKYRTAAHAGQGSVAAVAAGVARALRDPAKEGLPLSPRWEGVTAATAPKRIIPVWAIFGAVAGVLALVYTVISIRLANQGDDLIALAGLLPPAAQAEIHRPIRVVPETDPIKVEPVTFDLLPEFAAAAPRDTVTALQGKETVSLTTLVLQSNKPEVFLSSRADLNGAYDPLIASIADVIETNIDLIGRITVVGHTDSIKVGRSNPFRSNQGLSEARAETIARLLIADGIPIELIATEGRAATEPVDTNATRSGRARNRRVEIILQKSL